MLEKLQFVTLEKKVVHTGASSANAIEMTFKHFPNA